MGEACGRGSDRAEPFLTWLVMGACADWSGALRDKGNSDKGHVCLPPRHAPAPRWKVRLTQEWEAGSPWQGEEEVWACRPHLDHVSFSSRVCVQTQK